MAVAGPSQNERESPNPECLGAADVLAHLRGRLEGREAAAVHGHLDQCGGCRLLIAEAARATSLADDVARAPRTLDDGERIGERYEVRRFIARGGMGEVYEARDHELGEVVALKTLVVTATDQVEATRRLLAEVRIARKVTHPNVCRILEFGRHRRRGGQGETPFLTMPLLKGETLAARLAGGARIASAECLRILRELARGLGAVHAEGIIHRDFKSENVFMVRNDDGGERAVVMDFGLARALELQAGGAASGPLVLGTPAYMAPEQVQGKLVTRAADVFAFGVVAFEMLTGGRPFGGESPTGVALARLTTQARRPSSVVAGLDRRWDDFVGRCLKLDPRQRFATMADIAAALDRLETSAPARPFSRRRVVFVSAVFAAAIIVPLALVTKDAARPSIPAPPSPVVATAPAVGKVAPPIPEAPALSSPQLRKRARSERRPRAVAIFSNPAAEQSQEQALPAELEPPRATRVRNGDDLVDPF